MLPDESGIALAIAQGPTRVPGPVEHALPLRSEK